MAMRYRGIGVGGLALAMLWPGIGQGEEVACRYTYGGESHWLRAVPTEAIYGIPDLAVGSYFRLRVVFRKRPSDIAGVWIYTYADQETGPVLIHQASYPYAMLKQGRSAYGFTGMQRVYEPVRDGELQYWCEWRGRAAR